MRKGRKGVLRHGRSNDQRKNSEAQMNCDHTILIPAAIVLLLAWFALSAFAECEWQKAERKERRRVERHVGEKYPKVY